MPRGWRQGIYTPRNPNKYRGDATKIRYMSSWEQKLHQFLDSNPNILEWSSEEIAIPYLKPTTGRIHKYFPDYWVKFRNKHGEIVEEMWELKPNNQISLPSRRGKRKKQQIVEAVQFEVNKAKWKAAQAFCDKRGIKFRLVTENQLFK